MLGGTQRCSPGICERHGALSSLDVPDLGDAVFAPGGEEGCVCWVEGNAEHPVRMPCKRHDALSSLNVPDLGGLFSSGDVRLERGVAVAALQPSAAAPSDQPSKPQAGWLTRAVPAVTAAVVPLSLL